MDNDNSRSGLKFNLFPVQWQNRRWLVVFVHRDQGNRDIAYHVAAVHRRYGPYNLDRLGVYLGCIPKDQEWGCFNCPLNHPLLIEIVSDEIFDGSAVDEIDPSDHLLQINYNPELILPPGKPAPSDIEVSRWLFHENGEFSFDTYRRDSGHGGGAEAPFSLSIKALEDRRAEAAIVDPGISDHPAFCWSAQTHDTGIKEIGPVQAIEIEAQQTIHVSVKHKRHQLLEARQALPAGQDPNSVQRLVLSFDCTHSFRRNAELAARLIGFVWPSGEAPPILLPLAQATPLDSASPQGSYALGLRTKPLMRSRSNQYERELRYYVAQDEDVKTYDAPFKDEGSKPVTGNDESFSFTPVWAAPFDIVGVWAGAGVSLAIDLPNKDMFVKEFPKVGTLFAFRVGVDAKPYPLAANIRDGIAKKFADDPGILGLDELKDLADSRPADKSLGVQTLKLSKEIGTHGTPLFRFYTEQHNMFQALSSSEKRRVLPFLEGLRIKLDDFGTWIDYPSFPGLFLKNAVFQDKLVRSPSETMDPPWLKEESAALLTAAAVAGYTDDEELENFVATLSWPRQLCFTEFVLAGTDPYWFVRNNIIPNMRPVHDRYEEEILSSYSEKEWVSRLLEAAFASQHGYIEDDHIRNIAPHRLTISDEGAQPGPVLLSDLRKEAQLFVRLKDVANTHASELRAVLFAMGVQLDEHTSFKERPSPIVIERSALAGSSAEATPEGEANPSDRSGLDKVLSEYRKRYDAEFRAVRDTIKTQCESSLKLRWDTLEPHLNNIASRDCLHYVQQAFKKLQAQHTSLSGFHHVGRLILKGDWDALKTLDWTAVHQETVEFAAMKQIEENIILLSKQLSTNRLGMDRLREKGISDDQDVDVFEFVTRTRAELNGLRSKLTAKLDLARTDQDDTPRIGTEAFNTYFSALHTVIEGFAVRQLWTSRHQELKRVLEYLNSKEDFAEAASLKQEVTILVYRQSAPVQDWPDLIDRIDTVLKRAGKIQKRQEAPVAAS